MSKTYDELKEAIKKATDEGVSIPDAERLAAKTLTARIELSEEIKTQAIDAKMKRLGVKAVQAETYKKATEGVEKKPTEAALIHTINLNPEVIQEEINHAEAEAELEYKQSLLEIFKDAHLYFRSIMKGSFEG